MNPRAGLLAIFCPVVWMGACSGDSPALQPSRDVDEALARAVTYLAASQGADGGWHSEYYGILRSGYSLTAVILHALARLPAELRAGHAQVLERALSFLATGTDADGAVGLSASPVDYPNYTSAYYLWALVELQPEGWQASAERQIEQLRRVQLVEALGWAPEDLEYGAHSFGGRPELKEFGASLLNLSVTTAVVEALRAAGLPADDPAVARARVFVERCQDFVPGSSVGDGGFVFTTVDIVDVSKAGTRTDAEGVQRPRSYGSMTCDGLRALLACGAPGDDPRVAAARSWLQQGFRIDRVPGFPEDQDPTFEPGLRLYYLSSLAQTLEELHVPAVRRAALANRLLARQRSDGAFVGFSPLMKEDDPLVATPLAILGLAALRR